MVNFALHIFTKIKVLLFEFLELSYFKTLVLVRAVGRVLVTRNPLEFHGLDFSADAHSLITPLT